MRLLGCEIRKVIEMLVCAGGLCAVLQAQTPTPPQEAKSGEKCKKCYDEGIKYLVQKDYRQAVESFKQAVEATPNKDEAHYYLGLSYYRLELYQEALAAYLRASELSPKTLYTHYELSKVHWALGNKEAAQSEYELVKNRDAELAEYLTDIFTQLSIPAQPNRPIRETTDSPRGNQSTPLIGNLELGNGPDVMDAGKAGVGRPQIFYQERASYTEIARKNKVQGTVTLSAVFSYDGQLKSIKVVRSLPDGLNRKAIEAAHKIRFRPATKDGHPVSVRVQIEYYFSISHS